LAQECLGQGKSAAMKEKRQRTKSASPLMFMMTAWISPQLRHPGVGRLLITVTIARVDPMHATSIDSDYCNI
jgi:hypothetical protein